METEKSLDKEKKTFFSSNIVFLSAEELSLLNDVCIRLKDECADIVSDISERVLCLQNLAKTMSHFPSIIESSEFIGVLRTQETLLERMCSSSNAMRELSFPTKSILGRSFLVAKFNFFIAVLRIAENYLLPMDYIKRISNAAQNVMFSIMAEDVYISLLASQNVSNKLKKKISQFLAELWEYRIDSNVEKFASVLSKVWRAREQIAPVFGTMLGTSELFLLSMELDEMWQKFMIAKIGTEEVSMALEEFLFGISFEDINFLRNELRRKGIHAIGRQEVDKLLGSEQYFDKKDPRQFYYSYIERRNNAFARKRLNVEGPKNTLEDFYISFVFNEQDG